MFKRFVIGLLTIVLLAGSFQPARAEVIACEYLAVETHRAGASTTWKLRWAGIGQGDTCQEFTEGAAWKVKTVHVYGTWGGATLDIKGRGDLTGTALTLRADPSGVLLSFDVDDTARIMEVLPNLIPVLTGGNGTTDLTVIVDLSN